jgi:hypothetical protein
MELDAGDPLIFAVFVFNEGPWKDIDIADFSRCCRFFVSQHFKVVLEHINQLI